MNCINHIPVRRLIEPVTGSDGLWAFDYSLS